MPEFGFSSTTLHCLKAVWRCLVILGGCLGFREGESNTWVIRGLTGRVEEIWFGLGDSGVCKAHLLALKKTTVP